MKNLSQYHHLYVQSDTLLHAPELAWQACFKKTGIILELLTDNDMLMMLKKELEVEHVMQYVDIQKQIINTWTILIKTENNHIFSI